jgi:hypothetical protein
LRAANPYQPSRFRDNENPAAIGMIFSGVSHMARQLPIRRFDGERVTDT